MLFVSFEGIRSATPIASVGEDLVSSRLPQTGLWGITGRYKIGPYVGCDDVEVVVSNEKEGTRSAATTRIFLTVPPVRVSSYSCSLAAADETRRTRF